MQRCFIQLWFGFAAALALASPASAQDRVALIVGNGAYLNAKALPNPPNDANDMAATMRELGFTVVTATNVNKVDFDQKVRDFARALRSAKIGMFFYAGHGMQVAGKNYAIPIDAKLEGAADLQVETVDIDQIVSIMESDNNRVNLVFLDACRDNPLSRSFARSMPASRAVGVGSGLTAIEAGRGTMIAFSTAPNKVALDGQTRNSPFTSALLRHIRVPGLDIAFVMRRVTADVEKSSNGAQVPWVHASLISDVTLVAGDGKATIPSPPVAGPVPDEIAWSFVKQTSDLQELRRFLTTFPDTQFRADAEARLAALQSQQARPKDSESAGAPSSASKQGDRIALSALSPTPTLLGKYGDWSAFAVLRNSSRECFSIARRKNGTSWNDPVILISNRPADKVWNELSLSQTPFREGAKLEMQVKAVSFQMLMISGSIYLQNRYDEGLISSMRSANEATLRSAGVQGPNSSIVFSMNGLPDAIERASRECRDS